MALLEITCSSFPSMEEKMLPEVDVWRLMYFNTQAFLNFYHRFPYWMPHWLWSKFSIKESSVSLLVTLWSPEIIWGRVDKPGVDMETRILYGLAYTVWGFLFGMAVILVIAQGRITCWIFLCINAARIHCGIVSPSPYTLKINCLTCDT